MIEVEAKVKIPNPSLLKKKIQSIAKFKTREKKTDTYYTLESKNKYPKKSLRIRKTNHTYEINFKQKLSYIKNIHAKKEKEFRVSDMKNFLDLINDFGFRKWLTKTKHSEIYQIKKNFHIEINHVQSLGWFLEIEYLAQNKTQIQKARTQILSILKKLNINKNQIIKDGYTKLLWDKKH